MAFRRNSSPTSRCSPMASKRYWNFWGIARSSRIMPAELLAQLYIELTGGRQIGLTLVETAMTDLDSDGSVVTRIARPVRVFTPSAEEITRHQAFIATLTDPIWLSGQGEAARG